MPVYTYRYRLEHPADLVEAWHRRSEASLRLTPPWGSPSQAGQLGLGRPLRLFRHEERFEPSNGSTDVVGVVEWEAARGPDEGGSDDPVRRELDRIVAFRQRRASGDLSLHARHGAGEGKTVVITGATGLVGTALGLLLEAGGYRVLRVSRSSSQRPGWVRWDPAKGELDADALEGAHAVVHLAGETIAGVRWTSAKRERILNSRVQGTKLVARTLAGLRRPPEAFVSGSAVGYYGNGGEEVLTEERGPGDGFLAGVARDWEAATGAARAVGIRTVTLRTGPVLSPLGGMLGTLLLPFGLGLGGRLGSGRQFLSWIDLDDLTGLILHAIRVADVRGPVNGTAPRPVTNAAFTDVIGRVLGRPTVLPVPGLALRAALGEMGKELLLWGQRAVPVKAIETGYSFQFSDLEDSLRHQLGRAPA